MAEVVGCVPSYQGEPKRVYSVDEQVQYVKKTFGPPNFTAYFALPQDQRRSYRNEYVLAQMFAIDVNYGVYEADLTREMQGVNFASTAANIALTSVATQVSPPGTKNILTATATALSGTKAAYDKDILIERTIQIIQSQMRASRAKVATKIFQSLSRPADEYPLMMAWIDLQSYYKAGTLTNGLVEAGQTIGAAAADSAEIRDYTVIQGLQTKEPTSVAFFDFIYAGNTGGPPDLKRKKYLDSLISGNSKGSYYYFSDGDQKYAETRRKLVECMRSFGTDAQCKPGSISAP
ncbi:MAG: hypothetical protein E5W55_03365 [Mesorhizobium sp.]|nr:MAG: hypothetical protein E5W55_03365 [Mesorhizobium sp.]